MLAQYNKAYYICTINHTKQYTMKNAIFEENEAIYTTKEVLKKKQCPCFVEYEDRKRNNVKIKQCKYSYDLIYFEQGEKDARLFARYGSRHYKVCIDILKKILQEQSSLMYTHF